MKNILAVALLLSCVTAFGMERPFETKTYGKKKQVKRHQQDPGNSDSASKVDKNNKALINKMTLEIGQLSKIMNVNIDSLERLNRLTNDQGPCNKDTKDSLLYLSDATNNLALLVSIKTAKLLLISE